MDIAPSNVGNDVILARLGVQQIGAPPIQAQPIRPQGAVVEQPQLQAQQPSGLVQQPAPVQPVHPQTLPVVPAPIPVAVQPPKPVELPEKCCAKCSFFRSRVVPGGAIMIGNKPSASEEINECRRFPPKDNGMGTPTFTRVPKSEWCGEFESIHHYSSLVEAFNAQPNKIPATHADGPTKGTMMEQVSAIARKAFPPEEGELKGAPHATNSEARIQSQPAGMGTNIPKKRGRPAKGVQAGSPAVQAETVASAPKRKGRPARQQAGA